MEIMPIKIRQQIMNPHCRAVVKVRRCPPTFHQCRRVEFPVPTIPFASRPHIMRDQMKWWLLS
jgi:hypothetical protein